MFAFVGLHLDLAWLFALLQPRLRTICFPLAHSNDAVLSVWFEIPVAVAIGFWVYKRRGNLLVPSLLALVALYGISTEKVAACSNSAGEGGTPSHVGMDK